MTANLNDTDPQAGSQTSSPASQTAIFKERHKRVSMEA
jgi:hypothetical protein